MKPSWQRYNPNQKYQKSLDGKEEAIPVISTTQRAAAQSSPEGAAICRVSLGRSYNDFLVEFHVTDIEIQLPGTL